MFGQSEIEIIVDDYKKKLGANDRYASFDYCYNYFRNTKDLTADIEKSCLVLGFYLASWGMYRGSSFLLQHSVRHLKSTIEYINTLDKSVWKIDVDKYDDENIKIILCIYNEIKEILAPNKNRHLSLVTKVMLGVFGCIPAFDEYFCNTFRELFKGKCGFRAVNKESLSLIHEFYQENKFSINILSNETFTIDFKLGTKTSINYPKAKIIDMYGFNKSFNKDNLVITEIVFEVAAEGGGLCIKREKSKEGEKFLYNHSEFDPNEEGLEINKNGIYSNFETPFKLINRYSWHMLYLLIVHDDYRKFVIEKLIEKLNKESVAQSDIRSNRLADLEYVLKIKLLSRENNGKTIWSYEEAKR